ncbi:MAG: DUF424 family protein [Candidatus Thermoplasmatota archaeon]|nr:DUF424 family protein [Candidatus Thermoplasmatota archaeon]
MISIKIYRRRNDALIAACDKNLIGKTFEEGKYQIEVRKDFYDGERVTPEILKEFLKDATIANLVGDETVTCAIEMGLIDPDSVIKIKGIPHAQMVKML